VYIPGKSSLASDVGECFSNNGRCIVIKGDNSYGDGSLGEKYPSDRLAGASRAKGHAAHVGHSITEWSECFEGKCVPYE
jgi:hypothetical protein